MVALIGLTEEKYKLSMWSLFCKSSNHQSAGLTPTKASITLHPTHFSPSIQPRKPPLCNLSLSFSWPPHFPLPRRRQPWRPKTWSTPYTTSQTSLRVLGILLETQALPMSLFPLQYVKNSEFIRMYLCTNPICLENNRRPSQNRHDYCQRCSSAPRRCYSS